VEVIRQGQLWFLNNMLFDDYKALFNAVTSVGNGPNQLELLMRTPFTSQEIWKETHIIILYTKGKNHFLFCWYTGYSTYEVIFI
jgi:hypothetical protein